MTSAWFFLINRLSLSSCKCYLIILKNLSQSTCLRQDFYLFFGDNSRFRSVGLFKLQKGTMALHHVKFIMFVYLHPLNISYYGTVSLLL